MTVSEANALLERLRAGDQQALAELYDLMGRRAFGLAYQVLRDGTLAEDVVQAAFVSIWEQAARLDASRGSLEGYLLTIVHRRAVDALRARARVESRSTVLEVEPADEAGSVLETLMAEDRAVEVREAVRSLPPAQREVVLLAYFEGLTQQEIAERLGTPLGTVKSRLRLAMERLRDAFRDGGDGRVVRTEAPR